MNPDSTASQRTPVAVELRAMLLLAVPLIIGRVGQMAMGAVDTLMAGPLGTEAVAALGLANNVYFLVMVWAFGLVMGADPVVSQAVGAGDLGRARAGLNTARWVALAAALPVVAWTLLAPLVLSRMGQDPAVVELTRPYLAIIGLGAIPQLLAHAQYICLAGHGITWPMLVVSLIANGINAGLNYLFIHGVGPFPELGVHGIALSTTVGHVIEVAMLAAIFRFSSACRAVNAPWSRPDPAVTRSVLVVGAPVAVQFALEASAFQVGSIVLGIFGATVLAGHQVALTCVSLTFMASMGLSGAGSVRVGNAWGRHDRVAARRSASVAWACGLGWAALTASVFLAFAHQIAGLFVQDTETRMWAARFLQIGAVFQLADTAQVIGFGVLRGTSDTRVPLLFNVVGYWLLGLPVALYAAFVIFDDPRPIWWGWTFGLWTVAIATFVRFRWNLRRMDAA